MTGGKRRLFWLLAKACVSISLIVLLVANVGLEHGLGRLRGLEPAILAGAMGLLLGLLVLHLVRWLLVLRALGASLPPLTGFAILYIGYFFNQALPSAVGGDVARVWYAHRAGATAQVALGGVLADRFAAILGIVVLAILFWPFYADIFGARPAMLIALSSVGAIAAGFLALCFGERWARLLPPDRALSLRSALQKATALSRPQVVMAALALSALIQMGAGAVFFLVARSLTIPLALSEGILLFPLITLVSIVPVSLAGWGVREGACVFLFSFVGMRASDALMASVAFGLVSAIVALPGGVIWALRTR